MAIIKSIESNSIADEIGLEVGDELVSINGEKFQDIIDYQMLLTDDYIELEIIKQDIQEHVIYEIEKDYDENLGIEWEHATIDRIRLCHNKCVFCFVDQIPRDMRTSLHIRDDDYRLSFLNGNYVTLTNVGQDELDRIVRLNLSPINISVHTSNPELRVQMVGNKKAGEIMKQIAYLAKHDLEMNTQIVLCPGYNDGNELERTISDLSEFYPQVNSVSVVPVGLTNHRDKLARLAPVTSRDALDAIEIIEKRQKSNLEELGVAFTYAADELYVIAEKDVPPAIMYDGFDQLENGVGLIRLFLDDLVLAIKTYNEITKHRNQEKIDEKENKHQRILFLTGQSASKTMREASLIIKNELSLDFNFHVIPNRFYGPSVTVTGLVTGSDIVAEWEASNLAEVYRDYSKVIIPDVMLKENEDVFLDNYSVQEVEKIIGKIIQVAETNAHSLLSIITGITLSKDLVDDEDMINSELLRINRYERSDYFG